MRKANKLEAAQTGPEMDTICNKCQKSLDNMRVNVDEKISTDEMIQLLKDGTKQTCTQLVLQQETFTDFIQIVHNSTKL